MTPEPTRARIDTLSELNRRHRFAIAELGRQEPAARRPAPHDASHPPTSEFGVKDNIRLAGQPRSNGSAFPAEPPTAASAYVVDLLVAGGAMPTLRLNMSEWALGATNSNATFGDCTNAWNPSMVAGGSSGGSAVAVALGAVDFALGTDTAGSIRIPACVNGVTGLRPTMGRFSNAGITPVAPSFDTVGPLARSAHQVATVAEAMDRFDAADATSLPNPTTDRFAATLPTRLDGLRVAMWRGSDDVEVDASVAAAVQECSRLLERLGARVSDAVIDDVDECSAMMLRILYHEAAAFHRHRIESQPERFSPDVLARLRIGLELSDADVAEARAWRRWMVDRWDQRFQDWDMLICPTLTSDVPRISESADVVDITNRLGLLTRYWSMYGGPSLSVPSGFHADSGMPTGVQLAAHRWNDSVVIAAAGAFQTVTDWHRHLPPDAIGRGSADERTSTVHP